jgi:sulfatase modifying factor 1
MSKYLVIGYLVIVGAILVITQIGIRNPWNPEKMTPGSEKKEFELLATRIKRERESMAQAQATIERAPVDPKYDSMVLIPAGSFFMGSAKGQNNEGPVREIFLDDYRIDQYEVTMAQFYAFVTATGHRPPRLAGYLAVASVDLPSFLEPNKPVVGVSWEDAVAYCQWKGKRMPTEAEWEKASRGGDKRQFPWGNDADISRANLEGVEDKFSGTAPVDSFDGGRSPYGVYNMTGNVMEWVNDWYDERYYAVMPAKNPPGPVIGDEKVIRGGSWHDSFRYSNTYSRFKMLPEYRDATVGFRCAQPMAGDTVSSRSGMASEAGTPGVSN